MDERLLAFTPEETVALFQNHNLSPLVARPAHRRGFGKVARLKEIAAQKAPLKN